MFQRAKSHSLNLPVIRKVICRDELFICSICRTEYRSKNEAHSCLNHCWFDVKDFYPVVLHKPRGKKALFRCHFCCRDYQVENEALSCARRCENDRSNIHAREQILSDIDFDGIPRRPSRIQLVALNSMQTRRLPSKKPVKASPSQSSKAAETGEQAKAPLIATQEPPKPAAPTPPPPPTPKHKSEFPDHWIRVDAKYQCRYCRAFFYTKMEAEACFNGHFNEDGFELTPAPTVMV